MTDAFPANLRKHFKFQFSVAHTRSRKLRVLTGKQEPAFHARQVCPRCKKGIQHFHVYRYEGETKGKYREGRLYGEKYFFRKGARTLSAKEVIPPRK